MTPARIIALSDVHEDTAGIEAIADELEAADLVILAGDLTRRGGEDAARLVVDAVRAHSRQLFAVHGNCDRRDAVEYLEREGLSLHRRSVTVGDLAIFGVGGSNPTPLNTPSEYPESEIRQYLEEAVARAADAKWRLGVVHTPPKDTAIDKMFLGLHVGSRALRDFLGHRRAEPIHACISGHIHESPGQDRVGDTLVVNAGGFVGHWRYMKLTLDTHGFRAELRQPGDRPGAIGRAGRLIARVAGVGK